LKGRRKAALFAAPPLAADATLFATRALPRIRQGLPHLKPKAIVRQNGAHEGLPDNEFAGIGAISTFDHETTFHMCYVVAA